MSNGWFLSKWNRIEFDKCISHFTKIFTAIRTGVRLKILHLSPEGFVLQFLNRIGIEMKHFHRSQFFVSYTIVSWNIILSRMVKYQTFATGNEYGSYSMIFHEPWFNTEMKQFCHHANEKYVNMKIILKCSIWSQIMMISTFNCTT